jgi:hypothetical protein
MKQVSVTLIAAFAIILSACGNGSLNNSNSNIDGNWSAMLTSNQTGAQNFKFYYFPEPKQHEWVGQRFQLSIQHPELLLRQWSHGNRRFHREWKLQRKRCGNIPDGDSGQSRRPYGQYADAERDPEQQHHYGNMEPCGWLGLQRLGKFHYDQNVTSARTRQILGAAMHQKMAVVEKSS